MNAKLPGIAIRTDVAPAEFIHRIESLGLQGYTFGRQSTWNESNGNLCLNVYPPHKTRHEALRGQLVCSPRSTVSTELEIRARWSNGDRPTYATYVATAKQLFQPLLRAYRACHIGRCVMMVESKQSLRPKLSARTQYFFDQFTAAANAQCLSALDWERFYQFIHTAHACRSRLSLSDLIEVLIERGFAQNDAPYLAKIYEHRRSLLSCQKPRMPRIEFDEDDDTPTLDQP